MSGGAMTDEQLLRDAAKATGRTILTIQECAATQSVVANIEKKNDNGTMSVYPWAPQANDIDAFRLAVDLRLEVAPECYGLGAVDVFSEHGDPQSECYADHPDKYAATRYAIFRAAAEVGRQQ